MTRERYILSAGEILAAVAERMLSMRPGAVRQRRLRAKQRTGVLPQQVTSPVAPPSPVAHVAPVTVTPAPAPTSSPTYETSPVTGPGADAFATLPFVEPELVEGTEGTPIAPPAAPAAAAPVTPEEAMFLAKGLGAFVTLGWSRLAEVHGAELGRLVPVEHQPAVIAGGVRVVEGAAARLAVKYGIRLKYQDEAIVVGAIGTAAFGLAAKKKPANENELKDANPRPEGDGHGHASRAPQKPAGPATPGNLATQRVTDDAPPPPPADVATDGFGDGEAVRLS